MAAGYQKPENPFEELVFNAGEPDGKIFDAPKYDKETGIDLNDYEARLHGMIDDAREFNAEVLTPIRERGIAFFMGLIPELDEEGRSTIVSTVVKDTVNAMLPSLLRIFTAQESTVNYIPNTEAQADMAEQATDYVNYLFQYDNPGYMILSDVFKDGLVKAMGVAMWGTDENNETVEDQYERLTMEERQYVISQPGVQVLKMETGQSQGPQGEIIPNFNLTIRRSRRAPKHWVCSIPPDEFRINRTATAVKTAALVGREYLETASNLVKKGIPREQVMANADFSGGDLRFSYERQLRNPGLDSPMGRDVADPFVRYGEYWVRIDKDDDGIAELRYICVMGDGMDIVMDEPANRPKMAVCCPDPEPHTIVGHGIPELVADLQVITSNMMRGALDSIAGSIYPRLWGVDTLVDWDDMLNQAIGAPIRVKDPNAIGQLQYTFIGEPVFNMMDRLEALAQKRTGITEQSKGLDPKALQSTTLKGIEMIVTGAQERIELVARTMAETFMTDLFSGLLQEVTDKPIPERVVRLRGKYVPVKPDQFDATMSCTVNGAMGRGSDMDRFLILNTVLQKQEMIITTMGADNPMVTPIEWRNAVTDLLAIGGIKNSTRYFKALDEKALQAYQQQKALKEDPNMVLAKAEADKVRAEIIKILADARVKSEDMTMKDDRERDKFEGDQMLKAFDIDAKYGAAVDTASIQALWKEPRQPLEPPVPAAPRAILPSRRHPCPLRWVGRVAAPNRHCHSGRPSGPVRRNCWSQMARPQDYLTLQDRAAQAESLLGHGIFNEAVLQLEEQIIEQLRLQPINSPKVLELHAKLRLLHEIVGELRSMVNDVKVKHKQRPINGQ